MEAKNKLEDKLKYISEAPFIVSIMGQTGVGKSSLINALFGTSLKTDPIKPCTKEIEKVEAINQEGFKMWFFDLPGVGESDIADTNYFDKYVAQITQSDIIIWTIHTDNRSVAFDVEALNKIINRLNENEKKRFINSLSFVLTKADTLFSPPWIYVLSENEKGFFTIGKETRNILDQKSDYYQEIFLKPFASLIDNVTFNDTNFSLNIPDFFYDQDYIKYTGILCENLRNELCDKFPEHQKVFNRLYENYRPVYCSSVFKFNLSKVLMVLSNKMSGEASIRMSHFLNENNINLVSVNKAKQLSNMVIFNPIEKHTIFDLTTIKI